MDREHGKRKKTTREGTGYTKFHIIRILVCLLQQSSPQKLLSTAEIANALHISEPKTVRENLKALYTDMDIAKYLTVLGIKQIHVYEKHELRGFVEKDPFKEAMEESSGRSGKKKLYYYAEPMLTEGDVKLIRASLYSNQYLDSNTFHRINNVIHRHMEQYSYFESKLRRGQENGKEEHLTGKLLLLEECISEKKLCRFSYGMYRKKANVPRLELADAGKGVRSFVCHAIFSANGYFYLLASPVKSEYLEYFNDSPKLSEELQEEICKDNEAYRTYRVDRILHLEKSDVPEPEWLRVPGLLKRYLNEDEEWSKAGGFKADIYRQEHPIMFGSQDETDQKVRLRCDNIILNNMWDIFYERCRIESEDKEKGQVIIRLDRCSKMGILNVCLEYCQHLELLEPQEYRSELNRILQTAALKYKG